jgi:3-mercaptopyruvate sulfurtransferase SseA
MRKLLIIFSLCILLFGCSPTSTDENPASNPLPTKTNANSTLMSESVINVSNLDDFLFREDTYYVDTREINQWLEEGHVAGFVNVPFYQAIANIKTSTGVLYSFDRIRDTSGNVTVSLGEVGSFSANYNESLSILSAIFPKNKNIIFMSTAGVEASYLISLLIQEGYDGSKLYNAGPFSNTVGTNIAYRDFKEAKYLIRGSNAYTLDYKINFGDLTPKQ